MLVVLGLDQAECSGYSLWIGEELCDWGEVTFNVAGVERVMAICREFDRLCALHGDGVAVFEDHNQPYARTPATLLGMGAARGRWEMGLGLVRRHRWYSVAPNVWRKDVLGLKGRKLPREVCKAAAKNFAAFYTRASVSADAAEAIAIGYWGTRSPRVSAMIPRKFQ